METTGTQEAASMIICSKHQEPMRLEQRPTWTGFKTAVCTSCEREAYIARFSA